MKPTKAQMQDIIGQATELTWAYSIWWSIVGKQNQKVSKIAFRNYPNFCHAVAKCMQQSMTVTVQRLFDSRKDCLTLRQMVAGLAATNPVKCKELTVVIAAHEHLLKKCKILRHNVDAHRNATLTPVACFKTVAITPREFRELVYLVHEIVASLSEVEGSRSRDEVLQTLSYCDSDVADETWLIFEAVEKAGRLVR
jgi:hypothetical protein